MPNILKTLKLKHIFSIIQNGGCSETQSFQLHLHLWFMQKNIYYPLKKSPFNVAYLFKFISKSNQRILIHIVCQ